VIPPFLPEADAVGTDVGIRPQERPYFLFIGRLERLKGLDDVIPVFRDYRAADLLVAGDGAHSRALEARAAGIPGVRFLGRLCQAELQRHLRHAVALIVPSVGYETFGLVLVEAFREGTPVIARRIGPFPEIVVTSGGGELFSTPDELLAAMHRLQSDAAYHAERANAALSAYRERWAEEVVMPRYLELVYRIARAKGMQIAPAGREETGAV
jgi:glycosyltransferase involved in cell wall biosynthesis